MSIKKQVKQSDETREDNGSVDIDDFLSDLEYLESREYHRGEPRKPKDSPVRSFVVNGSQRSPSVKPKGLRKPSSRLREPISRPVESDRSTGARKALEDPENCSGATGRIKRMKWLWNERIPQGVVTVLAGDPGKGKSTLLLDMAAKLSNGKLEGEYLGVGVSTIVIANEDPFYEVVIPRLIAAGADLSRIIRPDPERFDQSSLLDEYMGYFEEKLSRNRNIKFVILDPLSSMMTAAQRDHGGAALRKMLTKLFAMAQKFGVTFMCNAHFRKGSSGDPMQRIHGSVELGAVARAGLAVEVNDGEEHRPRKTFLLSQIKSNYGSMELPSIVYALSKTNAGRDFEDGGEIETSKVDFLGYADRSVQDVSLDKHLGTGSTSEEAECREWLISVLKKEPMPRKDVISRASKEECFTRPVIDRTVAGMKREGLLSSEKTGVRNNRCWVLTTYLNVPM